MEWLRQSKVLWSVLNSQGLITEIKMEITHDHVRFWDRRGPYGKQEERQRRNLTYAYLHLRL